MHITAVMAEAGVSWDVLVEDKRKATEAAKEEERLKQQKLNEATKR